MSTIDPRLDKTWARAADYFLARGGSPDSEVLSHQHQCGCRDCKIFELSASDACVAIDFEERELSI